MSLRDAVNLAVLALIASCGREPVPSQTSKITQPDASRFTAARDADGRLVIAVTRDARVLHAGKPVTLDELGDVLERAGWETRVVLRVDADAVWCHVQWVLTVVAEHSGEPAEFAVEHKGVERTLRARNHSGNFADVLDWYPGPVSHISVEIHPGGSNGAAVYRVGKRETPSLRQLRAWIREAAELAWPYCVYAIEAGTQTQVRHSLAVLNEFHEAGIEPVTWGLVAPHPWVREQRRLPQPRRNELLVRWVLTDLTVKDVVPMSLPVASMAAGDADDDEDDRVIVNLDRKGRLLQMGEAVSLDGLRALLAKAKRLYDQKMRARGKSGFEQVAGGDSYSRLYVLLRADKDTPWLHIKWIMDLLDQTGIFKLQLAVTKTVDLSYTEEEAKALNARREAVLPRSLELLDAKLQCFLRTAEVGPDDRFMDVALKRTTEGQVTYRMAARKTRDLGSLGKWIAERFGDLKAEQATGISGRITAPDEMPFKYVVAVLNSFSEQGCDRVDFTGIEPAPREARGLPALPR